MREEDYKNAFLKIEMKSEMKDRIINNYNNIHKNKNVSKWTRAFIATACCLILFTSANAVTTYAYGYSLISRFSKFFENNDAKVIQINTIDRRNASKDITIVTPPDRVDKDLYDFLKENNLTNLLIPKNLTKDWVLKSSEYLEAGSYDDLKPSISFTISNGTDQIDAYIDGGISDNSMYQVGIDYAETKVIQEIEFLIVHLKTDLTYEKYLQELEDLLYPIMKISQEEFYKSNIYAELGSEDAYKRFISHSTFVDFSTGGYDYTFCLTKGIDIDDFIQSLIQE